MKKGKNIDNENEQVDDVIFEPEQDESKSSFGNTDESSKIKKLQKKLKETEKKAKENLDGWQRLKADIANSKQGDNDRLTRAKQKGAEDVLQSLLPALDSFDSAMQGSSWEAVDSAWRQGMEFVHSQLISALESHGTQSFGNVGDTFDSNAYDAAEHIEVSDIKEDSMVQKVLRKGYKNKYGVIRPARVIVGKLEE